MKPLVAAVILWGGLGIVAQAAPLDRTDWEQFVAPATASVATVTHWLGHDPELDTVGPEGRHYQIARAPYEGGVDIYTTPGGDVQESVFYLVMGPCYLESQLKRAAGLKTPWTLDDVKKWYGAPLSEHLSKRTGGLTLEYRVDGDPMRRVYFTSLPHSQYLHRIATERGPEE